MTYRDSYLDVPETAKDVTALQIKLAAIIFDDGLLFRAGTTRDWLSSSQNDIFSPLREDVARRSGNRIASEATAEALGLQHNIMRDVFQQVLRSEPFVIRRRMQVVS